MGSKKKIAGDAKDLTQGLGKTRHLYSKSTGEHLYKGKKYSKEQWAKKTIEKRG
jgi:hypothetical protein